MVIKPYNAAMADEWNDFVERSRQQSFLLRRDYMDYHADRFDDASLMAYDDAGRLKALLPANRTDEAVWSHQGLTYGGWITPRRGFDASTMLEVWDAALQHYRRQGARELLYKPIPWIYPVEPADDDVYALWRSGAEMIGCGASSAIDLCCPAELNENSRRNLKKGENRGLTVSESNDYEAFWAILADVLRERHGCSPVHSVEEMRLLASRFPENIRLYVSASPEGEMLGGTVVYSTPTVAHLQYIAASERGRECGALAVLFDALRRRFAATGGLRYMDFGISTEQQGAKLNVGLHRQKSGFGGRTVAYPLYRVKL